jgi:hypothetical protein
MTGTHALQWLLVTSTTASGMSFARKAASDGGLDDEGKEKEKEKENPNKGRKKF